MADTLAREWTYRTPQVTVTYPKGWSGEMPSAHRKAALDAGAIEPETDNGPERVAAARAPRRTRKAEG